MITFEKNQAAILIAGELHAVVTSPAKIEDKILDFVNQKLELNVRLKSITKNFENTHINYQVLLETSTEELVQVLIIIADNYGNQRKVS